jgi:hypothetical protein
MHKELRIKLEYKFAESMLKKIENINFDKNPMENLGIRNKYLNFLVDELGFDRHKSFKLIDDIINRKIDRNKVIKIFIDGYFSNLTDDELNLRLLFAVNSGQMDIPKSHINDFKEFINKK